MHGLFEWVDVSVPDIEAAASFYEALFGWTMAPPEGGDGSDYLLCSRDDKLAAGIAASDGGHSQWNSYVTVDSVDAIAARVPELGGSVLVPPMDIGDQGRMTYVADRQQAGLGFWQPASHRGADAYNQPGFLTWNEIRTDDDAPARSFYGQLFPEWSFHDLELDEGFYSMVKLAERDNAAIAPLGQHFGDIGAHWAVWFTVDDAPGDVERIEALGGSVLGPIVETTYGPAARVADPFGAPFLIIGPMVAPDVIAT